MRKKLFFVIISLIVILSACDHFFADLEADLAYWASTVRITGIENPPADTDKDSFFAFQVQLVIVKKSY